MTEQGESSLGQTQALVSWAFLFHDPSNVQKQTGTKRKKKSATMTEIPMIKQISTHENLIKQPPLLPKRVLSFRQVLDTTSPPREAVMRTHRGRRVCPTRLRAFRVKKIQFFLGVWFSQLEIFITPPSSSFSSSSLPAPLERWSPPSSGRTGSR